MNPLSIFRAFYHSNYPTYIVTLALATAFLFAVLSPREVEVAQVGSAENAVKLTSETNAPSFP